MLPSIVAVHGPNPINTEFHAEAIWTVNDKLWLRAFLPRQLPSARVLLFGYNANVAFQTSVAGVREQGINLLNRLALKREEAEERPIIFIAHSLGGYRREASLGGSQTGRFVQVSSRSYLWNHVFRYTSSGRQFRKAGRYRRFYS